MSKQLQIITYSLAIVAYSLIIIYYAGIIAGALIIISTIVFVLLAVKIFSKESIKSFTYIWSNISSAQDHPPISDIPIDIRQAKSIAIEAEPLNESQHTSNDWDLNMLVSATENGNYKHYTARNFGVDALGVMLATTGPGFMKLTLDENAGLIVNVRATVTVTF